MSKQDKIGIGERADWGEFPEVIRNGNLGDLKAQPEYEAAKHGDSRAALDIVERLLTSETIEQVRSLIGEDKPLILPVQLEEANGNNKIPIAMAEMLSDRLGLEVDNDIVQQVKLSRTGADVDHRLTFSPTFSGAVKSGKKYFIVDDNLTMGGTIASLRGYVENRGGKVIGASVMVARHGAVNMVVRPKTLTAIRQKHGEAMNDFWKEIFGYGIEKLTQGEAVYLRKSASIDAVRDRVIAARHEGLKRMDEDRNKKAQTRTGEGRRKIKGTGSLLESAQDLEREQQSLLDSGQIKDIYQNTLDTYVQAKHEQVEIIESRLKNIISQQQVKFQQLQRNAPGFLALPKTRRIWQSQKAQQQLRLHTLQNRLSAVVEIKDGMGLHSPRIEELATRKMRTQNPELTSKMDALNMAARQHDIALRMKQKKAQHLENDLGKGRSLTKTKSDLK